MSSRTAEPQVQPESARAPLGASLVGSRLCPVCGAELRARQQACSAKCRAVRSRKKSAETRRARDKGIAALLHEALRRLDEGP
jgi:predicted nucleic acid-binding Zn ribbon protein